MTVKYFGARSNQTIHALYKVDSENLLAHRWLFGRWYVALDPNLDHKRLEGSRLFALARSGVMHEMGPSFDEVDIASCVKERRATVVLGEQSLRHLHDARVDLAGSIVVEQELDLPGFLRTHTVVASSVRVGAGDLHSTLNAPMTHIFTKSNVALGKKYGECVDSETAEWNAAGAVIFHSHTPQNWEDVIHAGLQTRKDLLEEQSRKLLLGDSTSLDNQAFAARMRAKRKAAQ